MTPFLKRDALGHEVQYEYNSLGDLTAFVDQLEVRTEYTRDTLGRITSITNAENQSWQFEYDTLDQPTKNY